MKNKKRNALRKGLKAGALLLLVFMLVLSSVHTVYGEGQAQDGQAAPAEGELHILPGADMTPFQMTVNMIDFPAGAPMNDFLQDHSASRGTKVFPGLLSGFLLNDGFPVNQDGVSMGTLFSGAVSVNGLFQKAPLAQGLWEFDSTQCFASLHGETFTLYRELGTVENSNFSLDHGQFLPFNDLKAGAYASAHPENTTDAMDQPLPDDDARKGERLYAVSAGEANHCFGLTLDAAFAFPAEGLDEQGGDLIAFFTADDDLWVYIDGVLILDLGGIHSAVPGTVNFSAGAVTYRGADGKDYTVKLYKLFQQRYREQHPDARESDVQAFIEDLFTENDRWQMVFKAGSVHTLKLIYLERGAGASNLHIRLNLPVLARD